MPFEEQGRGVAGLFEQRGKSRVFRRKSDIGVAYQRLLQAKQQPILVAAGNKRGARGRTDGGIRVSLQKTQSLRGDAVNIRSAEIRPPIAGNVGIPEIVSENEDDIRSLCWRLPPFFDAAHTTGAHPADGAPQADASRHLVFPSPRHITASL